MHEQFEWNNKKAADQWRLHQARVMLASIVVVREEAPTLQPARAYVQVTQQNQSKNTDEEGRTRRVYTDTSEALQDPIIRDEVLARAIREAISFRKKYTQLQELSRVLKAIDKTLETMDIRLAG